MSSVGAEDGEGLDPEATPAQQPPRLPKFADEIEADQRLARHADRLERRLQGRFANAEAADGGKDDTLEADDRLPEALGALSDWKRARDTQLGSAVADAVTLAEMEKAEGNRLFGEGSSQDAYRLYKRGIDALDQFELPTLGADARKLKAVLCCNAAQALLSCGVQHATTDGAREMAEKALAIEPTNVKALFRRGCAHANAEDWNLAREDFQRVLRLDPRNEAARRELQRIRARRAEGPQARPLAAEEGAEVSSSAAQPPGAAAAGPAAGSAEPEQAGESFMPEACGENGEQVAPPEVESAGVVSESNPGSTNVDSSGEVSGIRGWCTQHELPELLAERLEAEEVRRPEELVELSEADLESLCDGLKLGPKGRFKSLVKSLR